MQSLIIITGKTEYEVAMSVCITFLSVLNRFSRVPLFVTPWTVALQAPLSKNGNFVFKFIENILFYLKLSSIFFFFFFLY